MKLPSEKMPNARGLKIKPPLVHPGRKPLVGRLSYLCLLTQKISVIIKNFSPQAELSKTITAPKGTAKSAEIAHVPCDYISKSYLFGHMVAQMDGFKVNELLPTCTQYTNWAPNKSHSNLDTELISVFSRGHKVRNEIILLKIYINK